MYIGNADFNMYAIAGQTGNILWKFPTQNQIQGTAALSADGRTLYFGSTDMHMYAVDTTTQQLVWNVSVNQYVVGAPTM